LAPVIVVLVTSRARATARRLACRTVVNPTTRRQGTRCSSVSTGGARDRRRRGGVSWRLPFVSAPMLRGGAGRVRDGARWLAALAAR